MADRIADSRDKHRKELAGTRSSHPRAPRAPLGMWRRIAITLRLRALRAWQRLRWRLAYAVGRLGWRLLGRGPDQTPETLQKRLSWTCFWIEERLVLPEYDDRKEGF